MSTLLILGAGGHGKVVADAALASEMWSAVAFLDDRSAEMDRVLGLEVLGGLATLREHKARFTHVAVAVGDARKRLRLIAEATDVGYSVAVVIHPRATVSPFATLSAGTVVMAGAVVNPGVTAGTGVIVNTGACVDHDCSLGDGVHICPGASLAGNVVLGEGTWVGIGASVKQGLTIGRNVMIGAGATVTRSVGDSLTVVGTPARPIQAAGGHLKS